MRILSAAPYSQPGLSPNLTVLYLKLELSESCYAGDILSIPMAKGDFSERTVLFFHPHSSLEAALGECICRAVVCDLPPEAVLAGNPSRLRAPSPRRAALVCLTPYRELRHGTESIHDHLQPGAPVSDPVITYLQTSCPYLLCPGIYEHPFRPGVKLAGPYTYTDGHYFWDRDTWKYVIRYGLTLPQEFIDHVMSDAGSAFIAAHPVDKSLQRLDTF